MLEQIYASKLYKSSPRKDKIRAAIVDPLNSELVGQLASALDDPYKRPDLVIKDYDEKPAEEIENDTTSGPSSEEIVDDPARSSIPSGRGHSSPSSSDLSESSEESLPEEGSDDSTAEPVEPSSSEPVQESSTAKGQLVLGSKARSDFKDMRQIADQIKGMLNFKDSTSGVNRILTKENELWVYYNDDVNLNNVMADAIELLNASCYTYLEFNRLARSDNAIVFQIDFSDTASIVKQIGGDK